MCGFNVLQIVNQDGIVVFLDSSSFCLKVRFVASRTVELRCMVQGPKN